MGSGRGAGEGGRWEFGSGWVLWGRVSFLGEGLGREGRRNVLGAVSRPSTVRNPPNAMSSGSGLGSWARTPTSVVEAPVGTGMRSVQPPGGASQKAVTTRASDSAA